jgi:hypothetical protein
MPSKPLPEELQRKLKEVFEKNTTPVKLRGIIADCIEVEEEGIVLNIRKFTETLYGHKNQQDFPELSC